MVGLIGFSQILRQDILCLPVVQSVSVILNLGLVIAN